MKDSLRAPSRQHLRLVVHTRVSVLDVKRVYVHRRMRIFEANADQHRLRATVAGPEGEVADAVEDGTPAPDLERLHDVRMVSDHDVRPTIHCKAGLRPVVRQWLTLVGDPPMERDDDPIHLAPEISNI